MKIFATGDERRIAELMDKLEGIDLMVFGNVDEIEDELKNGKAIVFDLNLDDYPWNLETYAPFNTLTLIGCAVKMQLVDMIGKSNKAVECNLIGMNCLPGFINRPLAEISVIKDGEGHASEAMQSLNWEYKLVNDRVGMVTPRVVFMIINEAFYTIQEGTATPKDIDLGMKLGTNYPQGPFEWLDTTGVKDVYETLDAVYLDTRDERYKICPKLKTSYLELGI